MRLSAQRVAEQAFTRLLEISQHTNVKLHAIVVATGSNIATPSPACPRPAHAKR